MGELLNWSGTGIARKQIDPGSSVGGGAQAGPIEPRSSASLNYAWIGRDSDIEMRADFVLKESKLKPHRDEAGNVPLGGGRASCTSCEGDRARLRVGAPDEVFGKVAFGGGTASLAGPFGAT